MTFPDGIVSGTLLTGAAIGLVAAFWTRLKTLAWRLASFVVVRFTVEEQAGAAVAEYLWRHGRRSRFGERAYGGSGLFVKPEDKQLLVAWEKIGQDPAVFWIGNRPLLAGFATQTAGGTYLGSKLTLTFVRGTFSPDALVRRAVDECNARKHGDGAAKRFTVQRIVGRSGRQQGRGAGGAEGKDNYPDSSMGSPPSAVEGDNSQGRRYLGWAEAEIGPPAPPDPLGPLAFPPNVNSLVAEARRWLKSERWYKDRRIPWRRGWLFYGPPGTGKSSLARAVAVELDLVLFVVELGTLTDEELINAWHRARNNTPCMVLIEDIDNVFHGRKYALGEKGPGLNYATFLNCASGVEGADGILLVVSTNKLDLIDPALGVPDETGKSTRPGRIDRAIELRTLDAECRRRIAARILADCPAEIDPVVAAGEGMTGAQFQELCTQVAIGFHWGDPGGGTTRSDVPSQEKPATSPTCGEV